MLPLMILAVCHPMQSILWYLQPLDEVGEKNIAMTIAYLLFLLESLVLQRISIDRMCYIPAVKSINR